MSHFETLKIHHNVPFAQMCTLCTTLPSEDKWLKTRDTLVKDLLFEEYSVHDAIEDVCSQKKRVTRAKPSTDKLFPHCFTTISLYSMIPKHDAV